MKTFQVSILAAAMTLAVNANAQMKAEKLANPKWFHMVMLKFKPNQIDAAKAFVKKNFMPVDKEFGRNPIGFETPFGQWDLIVYFPLDNITDLDYKVTPSEERWLTIFAKQQGSAENVQKVFKEWAGFVERSETMLVRQSD
jgi:hypothetical protein